LCITRSSREVNNVRERICLRVLVEFCRGAQLQLPRESVDDALMGKVHHRNAQSKTNCRWRGAAVRSSFDLLWLAARGRRAMPAAVVPIGCSGADICG